MKVTMANRLNSYWAANVLQSNRWQARALRVLVCRRNCCRRVCGTPKAQQWAWQRGANRGVQYAVTRCPATSSEDSGRATRTYIEQPFASPTNHSKQAHKSHPQIVRRRHRPSPNIHSANSTEQRSLGALFSPRTLVVTGGEVWN